MKIEGEGNDHLDAWDDDGLRPKGYLGGKLSLDRLGGA